MANVPGSTPIIDIGSMVNNGQLFRPADDRDRVEAYLPPMGLENHGANLMEMPNGDLLCVWFGGDKEGANNVSIAISRLDVGTSQWTKPQFISDDPLRADQNPILFLTPKNELWLLYPSQQSQGHGDPRWEEKISTGKMKGIHWMQWTSVIQKRVSTDHGRTWGPLETMLPTPGSFCRNRVVVLSNGDWLLPMYYSKKEGEGLYGNDHSVMQISSDEGKTWTEYPIPNGRGRVHPTVVENEPGNLLVLMRSRSADRIYESRSTDFGRTWTPAVRTTLPNNNASIQMDKLANGNLVLAFNHLSLSDDAETTIWSNERYPLTIALSEDGGNTWPYMRHIEAGDGFFGEKNKHLNRSLAYPSIFQGKGGEIHVAFSFQDRECIKYVRIDEEWIRQKRSRLFVEESS